MAKKKAAGKSNGKKKSVAKTAEEAPAIFGLEEAGDEEELPADETPEEEGEAEVEEEEEPGEEEEVAEETQSNSDVQESAHEEKKRPEPQIIHVPLKRVEVWSMDRPNTHPQQLVFKLSNGKKIAIPEAELLSALLFYSTRPATP